jgi:predicted GNAT family acetyltransferase
MIQHQPEQQRFVIEKDGKECLLTYALNGTTVDFTHTYVPFSLRGQGFAEQLVQAGLSWAHAQQYTITASCWYVRKFL